MRGATKTRTNAGINFIIMESPPKNKPTKSPTMAATMKETDNLTLTKIDNAVKNNKSIMRNIASKSRKGLLKQLPEAGFEPAYPLGIRF